MVRMRKQKRAVVAGTIALDVVPQFPKEACEKNALIEEGKTLYIPDIKVILGGLVANTGISMGRLGAEVLLSSKVGDDPFGAIIRRLLEETKVPFQLDVSAHKGTSMTIVVTPEHADRTFWHRRGASQEYCFEDLPLEELKKASLLHFGYPTGMPCFHSDHGERLTLLLKQVKKLGLATSLDLSLPGLSSESGRADWKTIMKNVLPYVDVFLPSLEETLFIFRREQYMEVLKNAEGKCAIDYIDLGILEELGEEVLSMGPKVFLLKLGKKGLYLKTASGSGFTHMGELAESFSEKWYGREMMMTPFWPEHIVSTNGAGDTAIAGFLTGMLKGWEPDQCMQLASGAACIRIQSSKGANGLPAWEQIMQKIKMGWKHMDVAEPDRSYWEKDTEKQVYLGKHDSLKKKKGEK